MLKQPAALSTSQIRQQNTAAAYQWAQDLADKGYSINDALGLLYQNAPHFEGDGVSVDDIEKQIRRIYLGQQLAKMKEDQQQAENKVRDLNNMGMPWGKKPWQI